jgi:hypothetical protein
VGVWTRCTAPAVVLWLLFFFAPRDEYQFALVPKVFLKTNYGTALPMYKNIS